MAIFELEFLSDNQKDTAKAWRYTPLGKPRGVVQVMHGFGEHSRRYLNLILALNKAGFVAAADDHVGHGKTAYDSGNWSNWGNTGYQTMIKDEHTLYQMTRKEYPNLPYFLLGHSMGSMIIRNFIVDYKEPLAGVLFLGTTAHFPEADAIAKTLKSLMDEGKGDDVEPKYLGQLMGLMTDQDPTGEMSYGWISSDPEVVADYIADPFTSHPNLPNIRSLYYFIMMMTYINGKEWAEKVPSSLPIHIVSGEADPVGLYGKGVKDLVQWLESTNHRVDFHLYPGKRHEIYNYRDVQDKVIADILSFIETNLPK